MTTLFQFTPSQLQPFQFQPTLDDVIYTAIITWSLFGRRYYLNIFDLNQELILTEALVGSPDGITVQGLFWDAGTVQVSTLVPHGYRIGNTTRLTISGCVPDAYNGTFDMLATGPQTLSYDLTADPGLPSTLGSVAYNIDLLGYKFKSTMVFRGSSQIFEVSP